MRFRKHFNSASELMAWRAPFKDKNLGNEFCSPLEIETGERAMGQGAQEYVAAIEALRATMWKSVPSLQRTWRLEVAGAFPCVPAFLAGEPENMWFPTEERKDTAPIRIWVGVSSSSGVSNRELIKRGAALAAFAQALSQVRMVSLTPYTSFGEWRRRASSDADCIISWDIGASPMVLSEVAAALCEPCVSRSLLMHLADNVQPLWKAGWCEGRDDEAHMRAVLGAKEDDLWLGSLHLYDPLLSDPEKWIREKLEVYANAE